MTKTACTEDLGEVKSVDRYIRRLRKEIFKKERGCNAQVFFRGEKCCDYKLKPNLFRKNKIDLKQREADMLERLELMEPGAFSENPASIDRLVMARHHKLPTRLLDVTRDPLVALYFASEKSEGCERCADIGKVHAFVVRNGTAVKSANSDTVSMLAAFTMLRQCEQQDLLNLCEKKLKCQPDAEICENDGKGTENEQRAVKRLQHFIAREKPYFDVRFKAIDFFRVLIVEPRRTFDRLRAQSGAVMLSAFHKRFDASTVCQKFESVKNRNQLRVHCQRASELWTPYDHKEISVPLKSDIRGQLRWMNVNEYTVMTGLDAAASEVERWAKHGLT